MARCSAVVQAPPSWASSWLRGCCRSVCYTLFQLHLCLVFLADRAEPPNYSFWRKKIICMQWQDTATGCFVLCVTLALVLCSMLGFDVVMKNPKVCLGIPTLLENVACGTKLVGYRWFLKIHACLQVAGWPVSPSQTANTAVSPSCFPSAALVV